MTDRELLIELLAIKLWEHDHNSNHPTTWATTSGDNRQDYRNLIKEAHDGNPEALYANSDDDIA